MKIKYKIRNRIPQVKWKQGTILTIISLDRGEDEPLSRLGYSIGDSVTFSYWDTPENRIVVFEDNEIHWHPAENFIAYEDQLDTKT